MAKKFDGGPAFPRPCSEDRTQGDQPDGNRTQREQDGMNLRDWFAGKAMQGFLASYAGCRPRPPEGFPNPDILAGDCYEFADAMLAEREK
jgi:hypothetical protein